MKNLILIFIFITITINGSSQNLIDIYKKGTVQLVPDEEYGLGNNWDEVFESYYDSIMGKSMADRKSLIVLPDGSVTVNHPYRDFYSKFSPNGKFQKEFQITRNNGSTFNKIKPIEGIVNGNTFFTGLDNMGNMLCFDFDGNYKKNTGIRLYDQTNDCSSQ